MSHKTYIDGPNGQLHLRIYEADPSANKPDLYVLHPAPFSGLAFQNIAPILASGRRVIAPDYPGYGGSDAGALPPSIDDYADAMLTVIDQFSREEPVHLMGFHTGCLVAAELARRRPSQMARSCLIDCPTFPADKRPDLAKKSGAPFELSDDLTSLSTAWKRGITSRQGTQSPEQAFAMFVEHLRPGRGMNAAFHAAFTYPWEERLPMISSSVMVLATQSMLLESSRAAAKAIPDARLVERLEITRSVLDESAAKIAADLEHYYQH